MKLKIGGLGEKLKFTHPGGKIIEFKNAFIGIGGMTFYLGPAIARFA